VSRLQRRPPFPGDCGGVKCPSDSLLGCGESPRFSRKGDFPPQQRPPLAAKKPPRLPVTPMGPSASALFPFLLNGKMVPFRAVFLQSSRTDSHHPDLPPHEHNLDSFSASSFCFCGNLGTTILRLAGWTPSQRDPFPDILTFPP